MIFSKTILILQGSSISAGYDQTDGRSRGDPANSGGSIYIINQHMVIEGEISSNGQSVAHSNDGPGSGGRILIHNYCWDSDDEYTYDFSHSDINAEPGLRNLPVELQNYSEILEAETGSIFFVFNIFRRCVNSLCLW